METLDQWIAKLAEEQPIIIVEGPKDKAALKKLGLTEIIVLEGQPLYKIVDYVSKIKDECIILTDLDSEGKKLY